MERIVTFGLIVYVALSLTSAVFLYNNRSSPNALSNTGIAVASILPLVLALLPYLIPEKLERRFSYILLYDSKSQHITPGSPLNVYYLAYSHMFSNLSQVQDATSAKRFTDIMGGQGLDIVEKGILEALSSKFFGGWDIVESKFQGPVWTRIDYERGASSEKKTIELAELQKQFKHNRLVAHPGVLDILNLTLPPESSLGVETANNARAMKISTPLITVTVTIAEGGGGVAQHGVWGVLPADPVDMNRYYAVQFLVRVSGELNRFKKYSPSMEAHRRWFENLSETLSEFDWKEVDRKIQETLTRNSISKAVGIPSNH